MKKLRQILVQFVEFQHFSHITLHRYIVYGCIHGAKNIPISHWSPEYPSRHSQVSGAVHVPPFSQAGSQMANKM